MRREKLLGLLAHALCQQPRASMEQLAGEVGVGRTTLHRYFPSRSDMLVALSEQAVASAAAALAAADIAQGPAAAAVRRMVDAFLPIAELYAFIASGSSEDLAGREQWRPYERQLVQQVREWQASGELRLDVSAAWGLESLGALLRAAGTMVREGRLARAEAVDSVCAVWWNGVARA
jgi:AcrR family transcriptional regulator